MQAEVKLENDQVLARRIHCEPWIRTPDKFRVFYDTQIRIAHWICPTRHQVAFVVDQIKMKMLCDPPHRRSPSTTFFSARSSAATSEIVWEKSPAIIFMPRWDDKTCYLLNGEGRVKSGSNTYGSGSSQPGSLCLGTVVDPFNLTPIEALFANEANRDLSWYGDSLAGSWENNQFIVTAWPTNGDIVWKIPQQIAENVSAWSQS